MKYVANGIYSSYLPLRRIHPQDRADHSGGDGQNRRTGSAIPGGAARIALAESGRYESVGNELMRFSDRNGAPLVLGMTHEEAAVQLVREYGQSHNKYPFMIYQIQTKFRDEARPRGGLIRGTGVHNERRLFLPHQPGRSGSLLRPVFHAYQRIFARAGVPEVVPVGVRFRMMGGISLMSSCC